MQVTHNTSNEVLNALPQVLIDYLWELVDQSPISYCHSFLLTTYQLGGGEVQNIFHCWNGMRDRDLLRVFGFQPVNTSVRVVLEDGAYQMRLSGPLETVGLMGA